VSNFRDQQFSNRFQAMGDEAEGKFDELFPAHHKLGLNRPKMHVASMSLKARYTPDRQLTDRLVEVMGCGKDQILKLKIEKLIALMQWRATDPVDMFLWDSKNERWCMGPLDEYVDATYQFGEYGAFDDGKKPYVGLRTRHVPFAWVKLESS